MVPTGFQVAQIFLQNALHRLEAFWSVAGIMEVKGVSYPLARRKIRDGDLLLFRPRRGRIGRLIAKAGRSEYSHAAMAAWWNGRLMCLETLQGRGGRAVLLSNLVQENPGRIDVYAIAPRRKPFDRAAAVEAMIEITGRPYGWWSVMLVALLHMPVVRLLTRPNTDDTANGSLPFCSQAYAKAFRAGGIDPVPRLADRQTEPGDLARSSLFRYRFTLLPEEERQCDDTDGTD